MPATPSPQHAATADTHRADGQTDRQTDSAPYRQTPLRTSKHYLPHPQYKVNVNKCVMAHH